MRKNMAGASTNADLGACIWSKEIKMLIYVSQSPEHSRATINS